MSNNPQIPGADFPLATPGATDTVLGVDESSRALRRFRRDSFPLSAADQARLQALEAGRSSGMLGFTTKALMDASLAHPANTLAVVTNDGTAANNGTYIKLGASGAGSWQLSADRVTGLEGRTADLEGKWDNVAGIKNGWPDPFFRKLDLTSETLFGRDRWYWNGLGGGGAFNGWSRVVGALFDGYALRRAANKNDVPLNGPSIYLDEIGAGAGDTVTFYALVVGDGAVVQCRAKFDNGSQISNAYVQTSTGGTTITAAATPKWTRHVVQVPAGATRIDTYHYTFTADKSFDLIALWAFKGDASRGPSWPTLTGSEQEFADHEARIAEGESKQAQIAYVTDSYTIVNGSATVTLDGTGFSANPRDLTFMGWGERYTPAGVTFNAIKIKSISRTTGAAAKWRTLGIVIRTGVDSHSAGAALIAVGTAKVVETKDTQTDVTILLRDPTTNALKTLTDADFVGGEYFVGVYALKSDGTPAACGEHRGTLANSIGQSYYHTSGTNAPKTGAWAATSAGSNARLGVQHLNITSPVEALDYLPTQEFASDLAGIQAPVAPEMVVPTHLYAVQGRECNVYLDNLHVASAGDYFHKVTASPSVGMQQNERFTWIPSGAQAAGTLTIAAHDKRSGSQLVTKTAQLRAAASSAGSGLNKKVLVVGDSLVNTGTITQTLLDLAASDVMGVTLLGTRGTGSNKHEGRGGWTVAKYTTNFSDGTYGANPFWKAGAVNFAQYLTDNSIPTPDWVFIHLGINDVFSQSDDTACAALADGIFTSLDALVASIKASDANVKIGLMIPSPPSADQDSFGLSEALGATRWRFKRNILIWTRQLIAKYVGQEANRIYVVPSNTALDTVNNMSRAASAPVNSRSAVTVMRQSNGVHPADGGYRQIADAVWAFLKYYAGA